jgi:hypothetical protein
MALVADGPDGAWCYVTSGAYYIMNGRRRRESFGASAVVLRRYLAHIHIA